MHGAKTVLAKNAKQLGSLCSSYSAMPAPAANGVVHHDTFRHSDLVVELTKAPKPKTPLEDLTFGTTFTDHMFHVEHVRGEGWGTPKIMPFAMIPVHPAAQAIHYGMSCFEGMKSYMGPDGRGYLFRPHMNMRRFYKSSRRLLLADFDPQELLACLKELLAIEKSWLPNREGYSLYMRPFMFASSHSFSMTTPTRTTLSIALSPVGPYFPTGLRPIQLFVDEVNVRAWPGGVGDSKVASNYGPTIKPSVDAMREHGTPQVLYTLPTAGGSPDDALVSEVGSMNVMFLFDKADGTGKELATPPLDGTVLPGVTRDSILAIVRGWGEFDVAERDITVGEIRKASAEGRLREIFGCGTACIVQPVEALVRANGEVYETPVDLTDATSLSQRLIRELTDYHYARKGSDWSVPFD